jgi:outer membrane putative beta-barrel porin/alpha-amylase
MTALRTATVTICFALLTAGSALAGPPLITDDAGTVDVGKAEIELNGSSPYDKDITAGVTTKNNTLDTEIKITTGLYKNLGISLAIPYTVSARVVEDGQLVSKAEGLGDMTAELKYAFTELAGVTFAIKPSIIMPTGRYNAGLSEGRWQLGTTLIATREFEEGKYALHANLGYEHHTYRTDEVRNSTRSSIWSGSIAGETRLVKGLIAVLDFGLATNTDKESTELPVYALTGLRYEISDNLDINAGVKLGLTEPEDDVTVLYGLVLKF